MSPALYHAAMERAPSETLLLRLGKRRDPVRWDDWRWQLRHRVRTLEQLRRLVPAVRDLSAAGGDLVARAPVSVTPHYLSLADPHDPSDPILRQVFPASAEERVLPGESPDPFDERALSPVPGIVRRYPDRALLLPTNFCATLCRHCFRRDSWGEGFSFLDDATLARAVEWIRSEEAVRDVLITGGDPLHLPTRRIARLLDDLLAIERLDVVRIATRTPVTLPQRFDTPLFDALARRRRLWIVTHFNHPREVSPASRRVLDRLADLGVPVLNQSVLLRGVNDRADTIERLCRLLVRVGVRPYYLHAADPVSGAGHFRVPLAEARAIVRALHGRLTGFAVPRLVVDLPGGAGKAPVDLGFGPLETNGGVLFEGPIDGRRVEYPEPGGGC